MSEELPSQPAAPRFPGAGSPPRARRVAANIRNSSTGPSCSSKSPGRISLLKPSSGFPCHVWLSRPTFRILCEGKSRNGLQIPGWVLLSLCVTHTTTHTHTVLYLSQHTHIYLIPHSPHTHTTAHTNCTVLATTHTHISYHTHHIHTDTQNHAYNHTHA